MKNSYLFIKSSLLFSATPVINWYKHLKELLANDFQHSNLFRHLTVIIRHRWSWEVQKMVATNFHIEREKQHRKPQNSMTTLGMKLVENSKTQADRDKPPTATRPVCYRRLCGRGKGKHKGSTCQPDTDRRCALGVWRLTEEAQLRSGGDLLFPNNE